MISPDSRIAGDFDFGRNFRLTVGERQSKKSRLFGSRDKGKTVLRDQTSLGVESVNPRSIVDSAAGDSVAVVTARHDAFC